MPYPEITSEIRFDLFKLHDSELDAKPRSWICADKKEIEKEVHDLINDSILEIKGSRRDLSRIISRKLNISIVTSDTLVCERKEWIPLVFILELLKISRKEEERLKFIDKINHLANNTPPRVVIKVPKKLTINLCKIVGAHAADGCLFKNNLFQITDGDFLNVKAFQNWLKSEFDLNYKINRVEASTSEWKIAFHNKILGSSYILFSIFLMEKKLIARGCPM